VETLCGLFDKKRQWYYVKVKVVYTEHQREKLLLSYVDYYRMMDSQMGGVKLHVLLTEDLGRDIVRGRDSFLKFLRRKGLMIPKKKPRHTTDSNHIYFKYPNLTIGLVSNYPNHVWYADITYIWIEGDVLYLHLITDGYSHAVLGWCLSETLEAENTAKTLEMAIRTAGGGNLCGTIHHSDRGVQYACQLYVGKLMEHHIRISMTECYNPTDNAVAERLNGILKDEWIYHMAMFKDYQEALREISGMIDFYNNVRPHMSIGNKKPMDVYAGEVPGPNLWKKDKKNLQNNDK
jgi:transposase InsO family protein